MNKHKAAELPNDSKKGYEKMECNTHYSVSEFDIKKINPGIACLNDRKLAVVFFKICLSAENVFFGPMRVLMKFWLNRKIVRKQKFSIPSVPTFLLSTQKKGKRSLLTVRRKAFKIVTR